MPRRHLPWSERRGRGAVCHRRLPCASVRRPCRRRERSAARTLRSGYKRFWKSFSGHSGRGACLDRGVIRRQPRRHSAEVTRHTSPAAKGRTESPFPLVGIRIAQYAVPSDLAVSNRLFLLVERHYDEHRRTKLNMVLGNESPVSGIGRPVAVVTHHPVIVHLGTYSTRRLPLIKIRPSRIPGETIPRMCVSGTLR